MLMIASLVIPPFPPLCLEETCRHELALLGGEGSDEAVPQQATERTS